MAVPNPVKFNRDWINVRGVAASGSLHRRMVRRQELWAMSARNMHGAPCRLTNCAHTSMT